jgi:hypothetical protein
MISRNKDWFVQSSYWRNVSRVLQRMGGPFEEQLEVSVSPINADDYSWKILGEVRIRRHVTYSATDVFTHHFPEYLEGELETRLGKGIADAMLHVNLLSEVDPVKVREASRQWVWGGGIPFVLIARDPHKFPALIQFWIDHPASVNQQLLFLPVIREHEELLKRPVLDRVPRSWMDHYLQLMTNMQPLDPRTSEIKQFLEDNPVDTICFPQVPLFNKDES